VRFNEIVQIGGEIIGVFLTTQRLFDQPDFIKIWLIECNLFEKIFPSLLMIMLTDINIPFGL
jgi:hypothetical protein